MGWTQEDLWIGERLVQAKVLTDDQRNKVLQVQSDPISQHIRFGEIAINQGYCTEGQIESIGGYLGEMLVKRGVMDNSQLKELLQMQKNMRAGRLYVPNLGELATMRGMCTKEDIEAAIIFSRRQMNKKSEPAKADKKPPEPEKENDSDW